MIEMSVVMPLYRAKFIAWLTFESLCRQQDIDFEWELIMIQEENDEAIDPLVIESYVSRLKNVGCTQAVFRSLKNWIPLASKIKRLIDLCSPDSRIWTCTVADLYSPPLRLKTSYDAFKEDIDWFRVKKLLCYDILTGDLVVRRVSERGSGGKATKMTLARQVESESTRWCGVDGWFYRACTTANGGQLTTVVDTSDNWRYGFNTHGFHNITIARGRKIRCRTHKFLSCDVDLTTTIPPEILVRLKQARGDLEKHVIDIPYLMGK